MQLKSFFSQLSNDPSPGYNIEQLAKKYVVPYIFTNNQLNDFCKW